MRHLPHLLSVLLVAGCCGYSVKALLPPHLHTVSILPVENQTPKPNLDALLTQQLLTGFASDGSLRLADQAHADVLLRCQITSYDKEPEAYTSTQHINTWRITINASINATDQVKSQPLSGGTVSAFVTYDENTETEDQGIARALSKLSDDIVRKTLVAW